MFLTHKMVENMFKSICIFKAVKNHTNNFEYTHFAHFAHLQMLSRATLQFLAQNGNYELHSE